MLGVDADDAQSSHKFFGSVSWTDSPKLAKTTGLLSAWKRPGVDLGEVEGRGEWGLSGDLVEPPKLKKITFCNRSRRPTCWPRRGHTTCHQHRLTTNWGILHQFTHLITGSSIRDNLSLNTEISQNIGKATCWNDHVTFTNCHVYVTCLPHIILRTFFFFGKGEGKEWGIDVQMIKRRESYLKTVWREGAKPDLHTVVMVTWFDEYLQLKFQFVIISYSF